MSSHLHARRALMQAALAAFALTTSAGVHAQAAKAPVKVRYEEVVRSILYVPAYVALTQGFFKDAGLDVTMKTSQGTDKGMAALLSGSADIVLIGPEATVYVQNSESPVKPRIFSGLTATDGFLLVSRNKEALDWSKLKGKTIMGFRPGSNPDVYLETALRKHGIDPKKDVTILNNLGPAARAGAWMSGRADYAIFLEPEVGTLEREGKAYPVASIGAEVGQVDYTVFTTTDAFISKQPQVVQAWTNAIARAMKHVQAASPADLAKQVAEFFPAVPQNQIASAIERYKKHNIWKTSPLVEQEAINKLQDMLVTSAVLENGKRVKYQDIVVTDFAKRAK
ncbi:ABC transporter substrate-binding protein [Lacisediminimonas profundi]|uniref:ABC transporter substrate-binding protein n=1 Tax=Lacisediminimonas profundi TaxID=2603856 RepID=UPI00138670EA|nr:ABC transporter substrate-binding protein [Lacisediminimonas profundi]